jgi:hypothetical protein
MDPLYVLIGLRRVYPPLHFPVQRIHACKEEREAGHDCEKTCANVANGRPPVPKVIVDLTSDKGPHY